MLTHQDHNSSAPFILKEPMCMCMCCCS